MVEKSVDLALNKLLKSSTEHNKVEEKAKLDKLENRLKSLSKDLKNLNLSEVEQLKNEASVLNSVADYAEKLAEELKTKHKKEIKQKSTEEIKELLMTQLGIPGEFVDQLSILTKAGPDALKEAAQVYRSEARKKSEQANLIEDEAKRLGTEIKRISHIKDNFTRKTESGKVSMQEYLAKVNYENSLRDNADLELKEALEMLEGEKQWESTHPKN